MPLANDVIPAYGIRIDVDGNWYYRGVEMFRKEIVQYFYQHLFRNQEGQYLIELENDRCLVEVADCAFVVKAVYRKQSASGANDGKTVYYALLSDDSLEPLDLRSLHFAKNNIPYCSVKAGRFPARLTRAAYYQLVETLGFDEVTNRYFIDSGDAGKLYF